MTFPSIPAHSRPKPWKPTDRGFIVAAFAGLLLRVLTSDAFAVPDASRWLPTNTVAFVSIPDARAARAAWPQQSPGRLWADPAMGPFRAHAEAEAGRLFWGPLTQLTGFHAAKLPSLAEGQVTLAVVDENGPQGETLDLRPVLLLDAAGRAPELDAWFTNRNPAVAGSTVSIQGIPFLHLSLEASAVDEALRSILPEIEETPERAASAPGTVSLFVGRRETQLLASTSSNALARVLLRLAAPPAPSPTPGAGTLPSLLHGTVMVPPLLRSLSITPLRLGGLAPPDTGPSVARIAAALGLNQLRQASFAIRGATNGWHLDFRLAAPAAARTGVFGMFGLNATNAGPPSFVPAESQGFARARFSGPAAWAGLEKMVRDVDPAFLGVLQLFTGYAGKTEDADFDFQKGVIDLLGDDWITATVPTGQARSFGNLLVIGSPKAPELLSGLRLVASPTYLATFFPPDSPTAPQRSELRIQGQPVTSVSFPPLPWGDGATGAVHFAQKQGYVAFSTDLDAMSVFLATNPPPPLSERPGIRNGLSLAGGTAGGYVAYTDERPTAARFFGAFSRSAHALSEHLPWIALSPTATRFVAGMEGWIDPKQVPSFEKVAPHFGHRFTSGRMTPEGFEFTTFRPQPAPGSP